ncbi:50S ribosomal protein L24 [Natronosporangium hydrolyticum]|uniref:Large ribosomal subunit protein uL24 n=1 Tax=Natronosporangium hydrolyticum TaxID=2811111 RepID=A0A895YLH3_9ACTN|nr:50S ribosomal protein L24 [Natronosporangium hydrolyticum]QSB15526.1 50S ribosomal protein L24 [Natronosporangium hydrolyticum]
MKVKKNDTVEVLAGRDKGARGKVIAAYPRTQQVLVEGVNRVKKHTKVQTSRRGSKTGGIVTQEAPIDVSKVIVLDEDGNRTRVGYRLDPETGAKVRIARKTGKELP